MISVGLLGSVDACGVGGAIALGPDKQRQVLVRLILGGGAAVTESDLIDELWPHRPPASAAANLRLYAGNLRRLLRAGAGDAADPPQLLVRVRTGYRLVRSGILVDVEQFEETAAQARAALRGGATVAGVEAYTRALRLWRGRFVEDLPHGPILASHAYALEDQHLAAIEHLAAAQAVTGDLTGAMANARTVIRADVLRERPYHTLMACLYASGDTASALRTFHDVSRRLADELGANPSAYLRSAQLAVLAERPPTELISTVAAIHAIAAPRVVAAGPAGSDARRDRPQQLPADTRAFAGRTTELGWIDSVVARSATDSTSVVISAVLGTGGIGKTALAVHWSHRAQDDYPDGQLYVNLRGHDPQLPPVRPVDALRGMLESLGIRAAQMPSDQDTMAARLRSLLADRRMIILLDNARDTAQVQPLLPGSGPSVTLVTSRNQLHGLVTSAGAHVLGLDRLSVHDAWYVLAAHLGADRLKDAPGTVDRIIERCDGLPIALTVIAARAAVEPGLALDDLARELSDADTGLDALGTGDAAADVRGVFRLSYRALGPEGARMFRAIGSNPGPTVDLYAAASAIGEPIGVARRAMHELVRASLITETAADRYSAHDLIRTYAVELGRAEGTEHADAVWLRLYEHYLHTAFAGDRLLEPIRVTKPLRPHQPQVSVRPHADVTAAVAWFRESQPNLLSMIGTTVDRGEQSLVTPLVSAISPFLERSGHWIDLGRVQLYSLAAGEALGRPDWVVGAHQALARVHLKSDRPDEAKRHLELAVDLLGRTDLPISAGRLYNDLAMVCGTLGDNVTALSHVRRAYDMFAAVGNTADMARSLNGIGWFSAQIGQYAETLTYCQEALALLVETGDQPGQADTLDSIGYAHYHLGDAVAAVAVYGRACDLFERCGDVFNVALTLDHLGDAYLAISEPDGAHDAWRRAAEILDRLDHHYGAAVRTKLGQSALNGNPTRISNT